LHVAPTLVAVSHTAPHALQLAVVFSAVEHPLVFGGVALQSPQPGAQPVYWHVPLAHEPPRLCVVSHVWPQAPQLAAPPMVVSHPSTSGGMVLQSAKPVAHPEYWQLVPSQVAPVLWAVSHAALHAPQLLVVLVGVSQPSRFGAVVSQSAYPARQPV
jgi:hypothetical protein